MFFLGGGGYAREWGLKGRRGREGGRGREGWREGHWPTEEDL